jgi:hypothetical protein
MAAVTYTWLVLSNTTIGTADRWEKRTDNEIVRDDKRRPLRASCGRYFAYAGDGILRLELTDPSDEFRH